MCSMVLLVATWMDLPLGCVVQVACMDARMRLAWAAGSYGVNTSSPCFASVGHACGKPPDYHNRRVRLVWYVL